MALLLAMIAVIVSATLGYAYLGAQSTSAAIARNVRDQVSARHIAETGLELAVAYIRADTDWRTNQSQGTWVTDEAYAGGTFTIVAEDGEDTDGDGVISTPTEGDGDIADDNADLLTLSVTGRLGGAAQVVRAVVTPDSVTTGTILFVVVDADNPNDQDLAKQALMESWGFAVTFLTSTDSQAEYDTAVGQADVAYITEDVLSGDVNTKLKHATIGVVNEESALNDDFGLSSSTSWYFGYSQIDIIDNAHEITSAFSSGALTITSSTTELADRSGTLAGGASVLARRISSSNSALEAIDAGGDLYGGGPAAGRRVFLPWGGASFDVNLLTDDGKTLMRRAIEWGVSGAGWYDCVTRTQGTNIFAYKGQSGTQVPGDATSPSTTLSGAEYDSIEYNDGTFHSYEVSANNQYPQMRFVVAIDKSETAVTQIDVLWNGRNVNENNGNDDGAELHIWNYASASYEQLAVSADTESEVTLSGTLTENLADYLGGAGEDTITLLAVSRDQKSGAPMSNTLYTDYLSVAISSSGGGGGSGGTGSYEVRWTD